jgi:hypothetical protein
MTDVPIKAIIGENGEVQYVPYTQEEIDQRELDMIAWATEQAEREAEKDRIDALKASARQKLISGEPLTEEEASVIVI